jgi:hypothetical protein
MSDTDSGSWQGVRKDLLEFLYLPLCLEDFNTLTVPVGDTCRVISPVFEPFEAIEKNRYGIFLADIANDTAHKTSSEIWVNPNETKLY